MKKLITFLLFLHLLPAFCQWTGPPFCGEFAYKTALGEGEMEVSTISSWKNGSLLIAGKTNRHLVNPRSYDAPREYLDYRILCVGTDGKPCQDFGEAGEVVFEIEHYTASRFDAYLPNLLIEHQKKILVAGRSGLELLLFQLLADGSLDPTFGSEGVIRIKDNPSFQLSAVRNAVHKKDGKILLLAELDYLKIEMALLQFHPNGQPDSSFGKHGMARFEDKDIFGVQLSRPFFNQRLQLLSDESPLILGYKNPDSTDYFLLQLKPDGSLNKSLPQQGLWTSQNLPLAHISDISVTSSGHILLFGKSHPTFRPAIFKMNSMGMPDQSFGQDGFATLPPSIPDTLPQSNLIGSLSGGKITAFYAEKNADNFFQIQLDGSYDSTFGFRGLRTLSRPLPSLSVRDFTLSQAGDLFLLWDSPEEAALLKKLGTKGENDFSLSPSGYQPVSPPEGGSVPLAMAEDSTGRLWICGASEYPTWGSGNNPPKNQGFLHSFLPHQACFPGHSFLQKQQAADVFYADLLQAGDSLLIAGKNHLQPLFKAVFSDGRPEYTFDTQVLFAINGRALQVQKLPDGRIILGGYYPYPGFMRFFPNGAPDLSLASAGIVQNEDIYVTKNKILSMHGYADGRVLLAGFWSHQFSMLRFLENGELDPDFGQMGLVEQWSQFIPAQIFWDEHGRIMVAGSEEGMLQLRAFQANGRPDSTFGKAGIVKAYFPSGEIQIFDAARFPNGDFLLAGQLQDRGTAQKSWLLAHFTADGKAVEAFGEGGMRKISFGNADASASSIHMTEERIFVGGTVRDQMRVLQMDRQSFLMEEKEKAVQHVQLFPNPLNEQASLSYSLSYGQRIEISLYDLPGKKLYSFLNEERLAGQHLEQLHFPTGLQPGLYMLRLSGQENRIGIKVLIQN